VEDNKSFITVQTKDKTLPVIVDTGSSLSIWPSNETPLDSKIFECTSHIRGISNKTIKLEKIALIKFKIGQTTFYHYFRLIDSNINPIIGMDLLKRLNAKLDLQQNLISFFKKPRKPIRPTEKNKEEISDVIHIMLNQQKTADVLLYGSAIIPAKSYIYLPVIIKKKKSQPFCYIRFLSSLKEKYQIETMDLKISTKNPIVLIKNTTSQKIVLPPNTPIAHTVDKFIEVCKYAQEEKEEEDEDPYKFRTDAEIQKRLEETKERFDPTLFDISPDLTEEEKERTMALLFNYRDVFSWSPTDIGYFRGYQHRIKIEKGATCTKRSPPIPFAARQKVDLQIEELVKAKIIKPIDNSEFSSPLIIIKKPGTDDFRIVLNLIDINKVTKFLSVPFQSADDVISMLKGKNYISCLDCAQAYFQIKLHPKSVRYMTFEVNHTRRSYAFRRCTMGAGTSSQALSIATRILLQELPKNISSFADDIVLGTEDWNQQLQYLQLLFERLRKHDFRISPRKSHLGFSELNVLGFRVNANEVKISPKIANKIRNFQKPKTKKQLKSFVGLIAYLRQHVHNFTEKIEVFQQLVNSKAKFKWNPELDEYFEKIKEDIVNSASLSHFDETKEIRVYCDASSVQLGAILSCYDAEKDVEKVVAYCSRRVTHAEARYSVWQKELASLLYALRRFRNYILCRKFTIYTDAKCLTTMNTEKDRVGKYARIRNFLLDYDFSIQHREGKKQPADFFSRLPTEEKEEEEDWTKAANREKTKDKPQTSEEVQAFRGNVLDDQVLFQEEFSKKENLRKHQRTDAMFSPIIKALEEGEESSDIKVVRSLKYYCIKEGILYRKQRHPELGELFLLCIPKTLANTFFNSIHKHNMNAHPGITKCYRTAIRRYYLPGLKQFLSFKINRCEECQKLKTQNLKKQGTLLTHPIGNIAESFMIDTLGPFPLNGTTKWVHVAVEMTTRYLIAEIVDKLNADSICNFIEKQIILKFGVCKVIYLDAHPVHNSKQLLDLSTTYDFELRKSPAYCHNTTGIIEVYQRTIQQMIKFYIQDDHNSWTDILPYVIFSLNTGIQTNLPHSSHFLMFGYEVRNFTDSTMGTSSHIQVSRKKLNEIRSKIKNILHKEHLRQKQYFDQRHRQTKYDVGQNVLVYYPLRKQGIPEVWTKSFRGPCEILSKINDNLYEVQMSNDCRKKIQRISVDRLRPYLKEEFEAADTNLLFFAEATQEEKKKSAKQEMIVIEKLDKCLFSIKIPPRCRDTLQHVCIPVE
jgi:hypothetical protein